MWQRFELKNRAKDMLRKCFWSAVVVCLISGIFTGEFGGSVGGRGNRSVKSTYESSIDTAKEVINGEAAARDVVEQIKNSLLVGFLPIMIGVGILLALVGVVVSIFIGGPILVGSKRFFMCNRETRGSIGMILFAFRSSHVWNVVLIMFLRGLKTFLWGLLFVIPGIIKSYEYRMVPYILSENPGIDSGRAFQLSAEMMYGQKWNAFVLDLSFILWVFLGAVTCGLANVFFVNPYMAATNAELYAVLREEGLRRGLSNTYELPGFYLESR